MFKFKTNLIACAERTNFETAFTGMRKVHYIWIILRILFRIAKLRESFQNKKGMIHANFQNTFTYYSIFITLFTYKWIKKNLCSDFFVNLEFYLRKRCVSILRFWLLEHTTAKRMAVGISLQLWSENTTEQTLKNNIKYFNE